MRRYIMLIIMDVFIASVTPFIALLMHFEGSMSTPYFHTMLAYLPLIVLLLIASLHVFRLYHRLWRYASVNELIAIMAAVTLGSGVFYISFFILEENIPHSVYFLVWFLNITFIGGSRMFIRVLKHVQSINRNTYSRVLIVGADDSGAVLARSLLEKNTDKKLMGFIDNDVTKHGQRLFGIPVLGGIDQLSHRLEHLEIDEVLVVGQTLDSTMLEMLSDACLKAGCYLKLTGGSMVQDEEMTLKQNYIGSRSRQRVCVVGLGYIGLPMASLLATKGFTVHGVDVNQHIVDAINAGDVPIYEPELDILVKTATNSGRLTASAQPKSADVFILCVPTPFKKHYKPDLAFVKAAIKTIAPCLEAGNLIVIESTIPIGTTELAGKWVKQLRPDLVIPVREIYEKVNLRDEPELFLAYCPERVLPGQILRELVENDRIIGGVNRHSAEMARRFYRQFVKGNTLLTDSRTAEMSKLTENAFRDVNIAFANELALICDKQDINVWELINLANHHPRVSILQPGPGVGGHCIAVDPWFIVDSAPAEARLIRTARKVNDARPDYVVDQVAEKAAYFKHPVIACLGLAFKAGIDDLRESPAVKIVTKLAQRVVGRILVVEPYAPELPKELSGIAAVEESALHEALNLANIVVLLVNHPVFSSVDKDLLKGKVILDTRGMWR